MRTTLSYLLPFALLLAPTAYAETDDPDVAAVRATALDYIEGWYDGDPERMERSLHPDLAKRALLPIPGSENKRLDQMSAMTLVRATRANTGTPPDQRQSEVRVLDVFENAASVKVIAYRWIDYLHLIKEDGRWRIVNVLWELKPDR